MIQNIVFLKLTPMRETRDNPQLVNIDRTNIAQLLPTLSLPQNIKDAITNAVNQGFTVKTPQTELTYEDWTGIGYIMERLSTGEAGYMLSGLIAGGMTALSGEKWPGDYWQKASNPFSWIPNIFPSSAYAIYKIKATDFQDGIAGKQLKEPLQVMVCDKSGRPVLLAQVTFKIKAGGGTFSNGEQTIIVRTSWDGIAKANLILGAKTSANPTFTLKEKDTYSQQVGENIVTAYLANDTELNSPFTAYGYPDEPFALKKQFGDDIMGNIFAFAGFVSVIMEDKYGNPISNKIVNFNAEDTTKKCVPETETRLSTLLVKVDAPCLQGIPRYETCAANGGKSLNVTTSYKGASAQFFFGGIPNAEYRIQALCGNLQLDAPFKVKTYAFGNCSGFEEPSHTFSIGYKYISDAFGNNINAGQVGKTVPLQARIYDLREGDEIKSVTFNCPAPQPPKTCDKVVGNKV